ncbi:MAG: putative phosphothreonine lyase domain-containing protein [bacterium]
MTTDRYWIQAWAPQADRNGGPRVGKWIVTVDEADLDAAWRTVKSALQAGTLGPSAKARTSVPLPFIQADGKSVICVYTHDFQDVRDRERIGHALVRLGFGHLGYKTDEQSLRDWQQECGTRWGWC